ncbi:Uncharacterised protein [Chlamydia trachomatis]|nr:Uncharacterised protein [Chlamydia trachomatis]
MSVKVGMKRGEERMILTISIETKCPSTCDTTCTLISSTQASHIGRADAPLSLCIELTSVDVDQSEERTLLGKVLCDCCIDGFHFRLLISCFVCEIRG